jgi:serine phosphatase RsbU (regulator of sigma subunit)
MEHEQVDNYRQARDPSLLANADAVLICEPSAEHTPDLNSGEKQLLADALISHRLTGVVLSSDTSGVVSGEDDALFYVPADISPEELWGRVSTIRRYRPLLKRMEDQVHIMQRLGKKLNQQFVEVDQELRLASRLQRDFLPRDFPEVGDVRFATLYRPASWVSGDVYDVRRLDEKHIGFLVADAVGHGVAAGLLTMFIRQAVAGKRIYDNDYVIVPPSEVLESLNMDLAHQELPNCQFVTACYGTINVENHEVTLARGGHPHPVYVQKSGHCVETRSVGGLLGVFPDETFPSTTFTLQAGDKLVIYSDGMEDVVVDPGPNNEEKMHFTDAFRKIASRPAKACIQALGAHLDRSEGSLQPSDDQTCLVIERLESKAQ